MALTDLLCHTVTVVRPGTSTERGDTVPDWDAATETEVAGRVRQLTTDEMVGNRTATTEDRRLYVGAEVDVAPGDRVRHDGVTYEVHGEPYVVHGRRDPHHVVVPLRRVVG